MTGGERQPERRTDRRGFSLLELLVVVAIAAVLTSILTVSIHKVRSASRTVVCMSNLKTVAQEFFVFADDRHHGHRGDSNRLPGSLFRLEDFQEKLYRIHEFWDGADRPQASIEAAGQPLMCPEGPALLRKQRDLPCSSYAVTPLENVSIGFNMRLDQVSTRVGGWYRLQRTRLNTRILERSDVPLAFGVNGEQASRNGVLPYYAAPPAGDPGLYGTGQFWFPSFRHDGKLNVAFIGGHVLRQVDPGTAPKANWKYQPPLQ